jgi:Zn-dependent metalloprotease
MTSVCTHCSFIPPYVLSALASTRQAGAEAAARTQRLDQHLRQRRTRMWAPPRQEVTATGRRVIYDAQNAEELPGVVARTDEQPPIGDVAVDEAHASSGQVWDLFADRFGRASMDGKGSTVTVTVHFGVNYDNAFWDGQQLVFGDGDGEIFDRFTKPLDVMAHEFTHGVVQYSAGLVYSNQSGALNESVSDVFAALTKQSVLGQTAEEADWLIGVGLFLPGVQATALRSMLAPGTAYDDPRIGRDPQVGSMADYVETSEDNGGVHINSGIPNRAFALAAIGLGGNSWERAGRIWYDALTAGEVAADADFAAFARATLSSAARLFPEDSAPGQQVAQAWSEVGVLPGAVALTDSGTSESSTGSGGDSPAETVLVRRSGGFAGLRTSAALDLTADPAGPEVRNLLSGVDLRSLTAQSAAPDRFVYTVEYEGLSVTLGEQDLTPQLSRVIQIVLSRSEKRSL